MTHKRLLLSLFVLSCRTTIHVDALSNHHHDKNQVSRRSWLSQVAVVGSVGGCLTVASPLPSNAAETNNELPTFVRDYTKLAPLGAKVTLSEKTTGLSLDELAARLSRDLTMGATNQGGYFLTGDLSPDIFRDDAIFTDPTNRVASTSQYQQALRILFDPARSTVELVSPLTPDPVTRTIAGRIRSRGYLQLPWHPYVTAYESTIVYTIDENGLVARQDQTWSKDATKALQESFTPSWVDPLPKSSHLTPVKEPKAVTRLFDMLNGRRPYEFSNEEKQEIDSLIKEIVANAETKDNDAATDFDGSLFPGTWMLVYLQPGPDGVGIDRRIPFPEFDFNDSFQIFGRDTVLNVGQVLGPLANVQVYGTLQEEDSGSRRVPKRFRATIEGGKLCVGKSDKCLSLPIQGEGLFDSLYLGERLRIGQNLNGGGARVVQIRLDDGISVV